MKDFLLAIWKRIKSADTAWKIVAIIAVSLFFAFYCFSCTSYRNSSVTVEKAEKVSVNVTDSINGVWPAL